VFTQQDVQEFSCVLLDVIEKKAERAEGINFIKDTFCGKMLNYIKCKHVSFESTREETFYDLQLPVKGFRDVYQSLDDYTQEETLEGDNQYDTGTKFGRQDAKKGIKFSHFPKVMFFHLRRFEYDFEKDANIKLTQKYEFSEQLDLNAYIAEDSRVPPRRSTTGTSCSA
jgi:ubiquitin carboxyl-terminal hydrolase 7